MDFVVPKKLPSPPSSPVYRRGDEAAAVAENSSPVSSRLYLKPTESGRSTSLDKDVVLQRIRHRKRANRVRNALHSFLIHERDLGVGEPPLGWLDDAFSSP
uniref:Uncharacterized protein n=1 Tax=Ananas comosus var. bracteatus TaxID=296719 RepID=A0A6V7QEY7_ANACO|nr:unnamed protein product [Ananas comosus var. bracteatus]